MAFCRIVSAVLLLLTAATLVQGQYRPIRVEPLTEICMACICEAISNCNRSLRCSEDVCGLFGITWGYWSDSGKPLLTPQDDVNAAYAYPRCVNDPVCASRAVTGYMTRYAQDCNGDGVVNCYDYAAIHRLGPGGCRGHADVSYQNKLVNCLKKVEYLARG